MIFIEMLVCLKVKVVESQSDELRVGGGGGRNGSSVHNKGHPNEKW